MHLMQTLVNGLRTFATGQFMFCLKTNLGWQCNKTTICQVKVDSKSPNKVVP